MNTREIFRKINNSQAVKKCGEQTGIAIGKFLFLGAVSTVLLETIRPDLVAMNSTYTCEVAQLGSNVTAGQTMYATFIQDLGILVFWTTGITGSVILPFGYWIAEKAVARRSGNPNAKILSNRTHQFLNKLTEAVANSIFTFCFAWNIKIPTPNSSNHRGPDTAFQVIQTITRVGSIFCVFPLVNFCIKQTALRCNDQVENLSDRGKSHLARALLITRNVGLMAVVGSTLKSAGEWALNWFYNSTSPSDWQNEDYFSMGLFGTGALIILILALCKISKEKMDIIKDFASIIGSFLIISSVIASLYFCINLDGLSIDNFWRHNFFAFIAICAFSMYGTYLNFIHDNPEPVSATRVQYDRIEDQVQQPSEEEEPQASASDADVDENTPSEIEEENANIESPIMSTDTGEINRRSIAESEEHSAAEDEQRELDAQLHTELQSLRLITDIPPGATQQNNLFSSGQSTALTTVSTSLTNQLSI